MSYVPNNVNVYTAAYYGAVTGMTASGRILNDANVTDYAFVAAIAGAYAQAFDTGWGLTAVNSLDLGVIQFSSEGVWKSRYPQRGNINEFNPNTYTTLCAALIAIAQASEAYYAAQGITPPVPGGGSVTGVSATLPVTSTGGITPNIAINPATDSLPGSLSAADKTKLDGITTVVSVVNVTAPITSTGGTTPTIAINPATDSLPGSLSAADKTKLDGLPTSPIASITTTLPLTTSGGVNPTLAINAATESAAGSLSAADKTKLDSLSVTTFLFRPGGVASATVYTTHTTLFPAVNAATGDRVILFDGTIQETYTVPAGAYTLGFANGPISIEGINSTQADTPILTFANGATLTDGIPSVNNCVLEHLNTSVPLFTMTAGEFFLSISHGGQMIPNAGCTPFVKAVTSGAPYIGLLVGVYGHSSLNAGGVVAAELFSSVGPNSIVVIEGYDGSTIGPSVLKSDGVGIGVFSSYSPACNFSTSQPNCVGFALTIASLLSRMAGTLPILNGGTGGLGTNGQIFGAAGGANAFQTVAGDLTVASGVAGTLTFTVAKINGITLSGTPATGKVLTATSTSAANWQTPAASGTPTGTGVALVLSGVFVGAAGTIDLSSATYVANTLATGNGGTGLNTVGSNGQALIVVAGVPAWSSNITANALSIASQAQGDILYFNATSWVRLAAGTSGQFLQTSGAGANPSWASAASGSFTALTGDASSTSSGGATSVLALTGATSKIPIAATGAVFDWIKTTASPGWTHDAQTTDVATTSMIATPQAPFASATGANRQAGSYIVKLAAPITGLTTEAGFQVQRAGVPFAWIQTDVGAPSFGALYLGPSLTPSSSNWAIIGDGTNAYFNAGSNGGVLNLCTGSNLRLIISAFGIQLGATAALGGGTGVVGVTNASVIPTSNPSGGFVLYGNSGATAIRGSSGTITGVAPA